MHTEKLENFIKSFSSHGGGCLRDCECGITYWDSENSYDWEPGERETLEANKKARALQYCVSTVTFEGREYVEDCDCWHERAHKIMGFVDAHAHQLAEYLSLEKKRKQEIADKAPTVKDPLPKGWSEMTSAPRNATSIRVLMKDGTIHEQAHWASDLSGEEQPPFEGWFIGRGKSFYGIKEPVGWSPVTTHTK